MKLAILPVAYWYYLTTDVLTAILLTTITSFFGGFYLSVSFALNQSLLPPPAGTRLGTLVVLHQYYRAWFGPQLVAYYQIISAPITAQTGYAMRSSCRLAQSLGLLPLFLGGSQSEGRLGDCRKIRRINADQAAPY